MDGKTFFEVPSTKRAGFVDGRAFFGGSSTKRAGFVDDDGKKISGSKKTALYESSEFSRNFSDFQKLLRLAETSQTCRNASAL